MFRVSRSWSTSLADSHCSIATKTLTDSSRRCATTALGREFRTFGITPRPIAAFLEGGAYAKLVHYPKLSAAPSTDGHQLWSCLTLTGSCASAACQLGTTA